MRACIKTRSTWDDVMEKIKYRSKVDLRSVPPLRRKNREATCGLASDDQGGIGEIILIPTLIFVHGKPAPVQVFLGSS